jgi:2-oxoglutarate dehydrogenase E2 component (dihydrolipoamide succinyltransferase)
MTIEIRVPQLPESVSDATIAAWLKQPGHAVKAEEPLLELETDKVVLEVPAPAEGVLAEIRVEQGETVIENQLIAILDTQAIGKPANQKTTETTGETTNPAASPSVRKALYENDLTTEDITGSGDKGRILREDVEEAVAQSDHATEAQEESEAIPGATAQPQTTVKKTQENMQKVMDTSDGRPVRRVPMTRLRTRIAERLLEAQQNAAILSTFNEADLSEVVRLRKEYQERFVHVHGIKMGFMSFFVKAATEALKRFPEVNARIDQQEIIYQGYYDIGVAVSTERGLVVPVLRNTDQMGHAEIEKAIADYATRARSGQLELNELTGGTFSISNGGVFGSLLSTPILNPPQSAILGMHKIEQRPVAIDGEVVIRPMMYLALSYDHRLIDGKTAVSFLVKVKELLEDPASLLLEL